jgi:hypothetical protein
LRYAKVGQLEDDEKSWPEAGNLLLDEFVYSSIITNITKEIKAAQTEASPESVKSRVWGPLIFARYNQQNAPKTLTRLDWLDRQMTERFTASDITDFKALADKVNHPKDAVSVRLKNRLFKEDIDELALKSDGKVLSTIDEKILLMGLNDLLQDKGLQDVCRKKVPSVILECYKDIEKLEYQNKKEEISDHQCLAQINSRLLKCIYKDIINNEAQPIRRYFREQPYEQLAMFLVSHGNETEAKEILIAKNDAKMEFGDLPQYVKFWMGVYKWTSEYGYKPFRAAKHSIFFIFAGWILFSLAYQEGFIVPSKEYVYLNEPYKISTRVEEGIPRTYPEFNSLIYSSEMFMPFVDLHQKAYWLPGSGTEHNKEESDNCGHSHFWDISKCKSELILSGLHFWMWFEIIMGWILSTFFVSGMLGLTDEFLLHKHKKES